MIVLSQYSRNFCFILLNFYLIFNLSDGFGNISYVRFKEKVIPEPDVTKVNIIFMNHLDVGYSDYVGKLTGFSANVINTYFNLHYPNAINLAKQMKSQGFVETFRYTTHPWLLSFFLQCPSNLSLANIKIQCPNSTTLVSMLEAIENGDVLWHDGPMNMNFENMNAFGLDVALNISSNLNRRFGINKKYRVVSIRDVPGLTRGVIRTLLKNNVVGITSGVNSGSAPPDVPKLCRWKAAKRSFNEQNIPEIIYMQNPHGYPNNPGPYPNSPDGMSKDDCFRAPGSTEVLCFMFRSDNGGPPQSITEVLGAYEIARARYINAKLVAGTLEEFFEITWKNRDLLPVVDKEIGDTWIQGTASDPKKFARFRAMQREFEKYYKSGGDITNNVVDASKFLIKPAEHTYGLSGVGDTINWRNDQFGNIYNRTDVLDSQLSWVEQRQYEQLVLDYLGPNHTLTLSILKAFKEMEDINYFKGFTILKEPYIYTCSNNSHSIEVGFEDGAISYLQVANMRITPENPLGKIIYNTYNESDTDFFLKYYKTYWNTGYGKPNSTINAHPESKEWKIILRNIFRQSNHPCAFLCIVSPENYTASTYYGFPEAVFIYWKINIESGEILTDVFWQNKKPTRLMESISLKFQPEIIGNQYQWYFSKMGEPISPYSVLKNGSQWQHNVDDSGVFVSSAPNADPIFRVIPWDTGISCPIINNYGPTVWPAPLFPITNNLTGVAFNFYNNVWNTNYIYWYPFNGTGTNLDHRFKARFTTHVTLITQKVDDTLRYKFSN